MPRPGQDPQAKPSEPLSLRETQPSIQTQQTTSVDPPIKVDPDLSYAAQSHNSLHAPTSIPEALPGACNTDVFQYVFEQWPKQMKMASREALQGPPSAFYDVDDGGTVQMSKEFVWELQELPDRLNKIDENDGGGAPMVVPTNTNVYEDTPKINVHEQVFDEREFSLPGEFEFAPWEIDWGDTDPLIPTHDASALPIGNPSSSPVEYPISPPVMPNSGGPQMFHPCQ
ncbi:hypothetical protein C8J57DRAFT_1620443 [Mycena rebaudengoi]|nr:hypothetical protein C8J57DRAFT_1620443 [Mycena rebaudengoi]